MTAKTFTGKPCRKCGGVERRKSNRRCVVCRKAQEKARREANPEKAKARWKAYREANPEKVKAREKAWREANPEKAKARAKAYHEANPEKAKARAKAGAKRKALAQVPEHLRPIRAELFEIESEIRTLRKEAKR